MLRTTKNLLAIVLLLLWCGTAHATSLNLTDTLPDIATEYAGVSYNSGTLTILGLSVNLETGASTPACATSPYCSITDSSPIGTSPYNYNFDLVAQVNSSGNLVAGTNTFTVTGAVANLTAGTPLLTGNVTTFGISSGGSYEFLVSDTGGSLSSLYGGTGSLFGVIVNGASGSLPTTFTSNFSTAYNGTADIGHPTPEPASLLLLLSGGGLLGVLRKRFNGVGSA